MPKICPTCGLENTSNRTICKHCRAPLPTTPTSQTEVAPTPWHQRVLFRLLLIGVVDYCAVLLGLIFFTPEHGGSVFPSKDATTFLETLFMFIPFVMISLPLGVLYFPHYHATVLWMQLVTLLAVVELPVGILLTRSRLRLIAYCIGFALVALFLLRACNSVPPIEIM